MHTEPLDRWTGLRVPAEPARPCMHQEVPKPTSAILLERAHIFHGLGPAELVAVAQAAKRYEVPSENYFFEGGHDDTVYLLQAGCVSITQRVRRYTRAVIRVVGPGEVFGALGELRDQLRPASAQALCASRALGWTREAICMLTRNYPVIALNVLSDLEDQLYHFQLHFREGTAPHQGSPPSREPTKWSMECQRMATPGDPSND